MLAGVLTETELRIWHAWKLAGDVVWDRVVRDVLDATGLSGPDFGILSRLADLGYGSLRQGELQQSMHWDKTRLSHHLKRMEDRGLIDRTPSGRSTIIELADDGQSLLERARPVHERAVRKHLLEAVGASHLGVFEAICERLASDPTSDAVASTRGDEGSGRRRNRSKLRDRRGGVRQQARQQSRRGTRG
jgi:DNA-binding MarR family transcriptional regulator